MRTYMDAAGLEEATVHCLKYSFAKNLGDTGTPLQVVAQLAGHESLQTTKRISGKQVERISEEKWRMLK